MGNLSKRVVTIAAGVSAVVLVAVAALHAQQSAELKVEHAECTFFGPQRNQFAQEARQRYALSAMTEEVTRRISASASLPPVNARRMETFDPSGGNLIDQYIFTALHDANVSPADRTNDFEFIRRVTLDLTGRIPAPDRLLQFVNDPSTGKRQKLIAELMAKPEWIDKWTMYFGDLLKNTSVRQSSGIRMFDDGRNAFYQWIKDSLANDKPYDQMVREIVSVKGDNSYQTGPINWYAGGIVTGGPQQDIWDQQTANIAETFLGLAHVNCLECHNGRGHLDQLSLWGSQTTRVQAWQLSAFLGKTTEVRGYPDATNRNIYYWSMVETPARSDYPLNTTTGNRPARQPLGTVRAVAPVYIFNGKAPAKGEAYRDVLAREITSDFQFARAAVNYIWRQFFGRGIVEPANQFDPARLDPDHPPEGWPLQPSNARLLNALAQDFIDHQYDLKYLIALIANSETYQLSSRYSGEWDPNWEPLFARKLVRRLWGEEIMDALSQSSSVPASFNVNLIGTINWAMQAPEPSAIRATLLTAFLPGNRDDQERRSDGSIQQALALMNDSAVMTRTRSSGTGATASLLARVLPLTDAQLVDTLYLTVLSRYPGDAEKTASLAALKSGTRANKASDLLWSLYNKVDFIFNY